MTHQAPFPNLLHAALESANCRAHIPDASCAKSTDHCSAVKGIGSRPRIVVPSVSKAFTGGKETSDGQENMAVC